MLGDIGGIVRPSLVLTGGQFMSIKLKGARRASPRFAAGKKLGIGTLISNHAADRKPPNPRARRVARFYMRISFCARGRAHR